MFGIVHTVDDKMSQGGDGVSPLALIHKGLHVVTNSSVQALGPTSRENSADKNIRLTTDALSKSTTARFAAVSAKAG